MPQLAKLRMFNDRRARAASGMPTAAPQSLGPAKKARGGAGSVRILAAESRFPWNFVRGASMTDDAPLAPAPAATLSSTGPCIQRNDGRFAWAKGDW